MNKTFIHHCILEDLPQGDITTEAVFGKVPRKAKAVFLAKQDLVLSGLTAVKEILRTEFYKLKLRAQVRDGALLKKGATFAELVGPVQDILRAERLCLNVMQRLSGVATLTKCFADLAKPFGVTLLDTRKTTPGMREWEKQAVLHGGGFNHRMNLSDQYLIKDNHIAAAGSVALALERVMSHQRRHKNKPRIEVEVTNLSELREALTFKPDIVLLDNMTPALIRKAVMVRNRLAPKVLLEISGGVTLKNLQKHLPLGVERISIGALTHSAPAADISLEIKL
jgi:nicotinate-nucleotide pyrophosphorylase (carboxylating)